VTGLNFKFLSVKLTSHPDSIGYEACNC